jgi:hypothetical protein
MRTDGRTDEQTDRHDEANSRFSQFCERNYNVCNPGVLEWHIFHARFHYNRSTGSKVEIN